MDNPNPKVTDALRHDVEASWHRFLDLYEPLRPELYRYCRHLTRSPWDADDLVQDALFRAFAKLGCMNEPPGNPRAWLFRIASNLWIDRVRALRPEPELGSGAGIEHGAARGP
jgi:RNA polymerase sigma-70 factor, ECF subfamily